MSSSNPAFFLPDSTEEIIVERENMLHTICAKHFYRHTFTLMLVLCISLMASLAVDFHSMKIGTAKAMAASGAGLYFQGNGGYGEIVSDDFTDLDYSKSFSIETVVYISPYENKDNLWPGIITKIKKYGLNRPCYRGWGLGLYSTQTYYAQVHAKVGDGNGHATVRSGAVIGRLHLVMTWNKDKKLLSLYINGKQAAESKNELVALADIANSEPLWLVRSETVLQSPILYIRLWNRDLSSDVATLYNHYNSTKQHNLPENFSKKDLVSEWLMFDTSNSGGESGTIHIKDTASTNDIEMKDGAAVTSSSGPLTLCSPIPGATAQDKRVTLKVKGGYDNLAAKGPVVGPIQYYFQVDEVNTFDSANLQESGWVADLSHWQPLLKPNTSYYWRVKVKDSKTTPLISRFTSFASFTTKGPSSWYVRPSGGHYGSEDGTSYENAWNGFKNIVWGENGIGPGDTLYVLGTFDSGIYIGDDELSVLASGLPESPITITGQNPDHKDTPGIIWGIRDKYPIGTDWGSPDRFGVYSQKQYGCSSTHSFEDGNLLMNAGKAPDSTWQPGTFWHDTKKFVFYYKPSSGSPKDHLVYAGYFSQPLSINGQSHIRITGLSLYGGGRGAIDLEKDADYIEIDDVIIKYSYNGVSIRDGCDNGKFVNSHMSYCGNGLYIFSPSSDTPPCNAWTISNNIIEHMDVDDYYQVPDEHAIGIQGGNDHIVESNSTNDTGEAICLYARTWDVMKNFTVRYNFVKNCRKGENGLGHGIDVGGSNNVPLGNISGQVYGNIVTGCREGAGFGSNSKDLISWWNNVSAQNKQGYLFGQTTKIDGVFYGCKIKFYNNISLYQDSYHIYFRTNARSDQCYSLISDHNIFYPDGAEKFYFLDKEKNFADWKSSTRQDVTSLILDPHFVNSTGNYSIASDFRLHPASAAINQGKDVGLARDFIGIPVSQGTAPDIGAYEFLSDK
ncbi:MAG: choice-of-anchor Q domain-containing protein [bacterium]